MRVQGSNHFPIARRPANSPPANQTASQRAEANENNANDDWFAVLGLSSAATIEDVRQAYKTLIKQNHPDRVHGMAPVFGALAEAETKKINAAYQQALACLPQLAQEFLRSVGASARPHTREAIAKRRQFDNLLRQSRALIAN